LSACPVSGLSGVVLRTRRERACKKRILLQLCESAGNRLVEWTDGIWIEPVGIAASREDVRALVHHGFVHAPDRCRLRVAALAPWQSPPRCSAERR
jgi:hypothetical protein